MVGCSQHLKQAQLVPRQYFLTNYQRTTAKFTIHLTMILTLEMALLVRAIHHPRQQPLQPVQHLMMSFLCLLHSLSVHWLLVQVIIMLLWMIAVGLVNLFMGDSIAIAIVLSVWPSVWPSSCHTQVLCQKNSTWDPVVLIFRQCRDLFLRPKFIWQFTGQQGC